MSNISADRTKLIVYFDFKNVDIEKYASRLQFGQYIEFDEINCKLVANKYGKLLCHTSVNDEETVKAIKQYRLFFKSVTGSFPKIITYGFIKNGISRLPVKNISQYNDIFSIEALEIIDLLKKEQHINYKINSEAVEVIAKDATLCFIYKAGIDNDYKKLKYLIYNEKRKEKMIQRSADVIGRIIEERSASKSKMRKLIQREFSSNKLITISEAIIVGVFINALYEYAFKPILEILMKHFSTFRINIHTDELSKKFDELALLIDGKSVSLKSMSITLNKPEWDVMIALNWLIYHQVIDVVDKDGELYFKAGNKTHFDFEALGSCSHTEEEEHALLDFSQFFPENIK